MTYPIFLSVVYVVKDQADELETILRNAVLYLSDLVEDFEVIVVDNSSTDDSVFKLSLLTKGDGLPNLQVYALTKSVDQDTAAWVGIENSLGDFAAVINPDEDDINQLPELLKRATSGADVVFGKNIVKSKQSVCYKFGEKFFSVLFRSFNGINLTKEISQFRVLSKKVINFVLQHPQPAITYRHLPITGGFKRSTYQYKYVPKNRKKKRLSDSFDKGIRILVSTTRVPMRLVTALTLFGAVSNVIYSIYVLFVSLTKTNVEPGWVSLSLQQSGMFFLISLVLLVLGEYILQMASLSNEGPAYNIAEEYTSTVITRREKLNIDEPKVIESIENSNNVKN
ncbi:Glycosyltransferase involved in cell wall bisynthesis [Pseudidiomarina planktonica]|uniref:Glycosyltransferase involved in cell wall bisynthesis n=1 Tax=Pseudidiomarina planktonica TaxID=1323738 RepID=A0A1Y6EH72_9GAMM|nr:glycosyltransferase [Pseudidiomarina planktonica]RUO65920.1 glycosyl transferase [Pseudidiomarina planktonica]SMQ61796.1 Glycosyltransferase involved in cell wall bisynthesis [Pseudidiomarina planktonica]